MLCERCNENEATVHLTQVVDGAVQKLHLCEPCATEAGFDLEGPVSITDILLGMGGQAEPAAHETVAERACPQCHMTKGEFKKQGRLGCPSCYEVFYEDLSSLLKAVHHSDQHVGKVPSKESVRVRLTTEIARLQKELETAVAKEDFEDAAKLRDSIQACREKADTEKEEKS